MRSTMLALVSFLFACGGAPAEPSAPVQPPAPAVPSPVGPSPESPEPALPEAPPPESKAPPPPDGSPDGAVTRGKPRRALRVEVRNKDADRVVPQRKRVAPRCGKGGCPAGTRCLYSGNDGYCVTPCSESGSCANGGECGQGSSCPVCADAVRGCF